MWVLAGTAQTKALTEIDLSNGQTVTAAPISNTASSVAQSATGTLAVGEATQNTGAVELLNGANGALTSTIPVGAPVRALAFGADGVTLYVLNGNGSSASITEINASSGQVVTSIGCPKDAVALAPDPQQQDIWTAQSSGNVQETSLQTQATVSVVPLDSPGIALAIPPAGTGVYILKGGGSVWNIEHLVPSSPHSTKAVTLSAAAFSVGLAISADGSQLYDLVGTPGIGNVQVVHLR